MRRCLIAILMALALAFASAGCTLPHVKVPVPAKVHDFNDSDLNKIRPKHVLPHHHDSCYDDQGNPCSDGG